MSSITPQRFYERANSFANAGDVLLGENFDDMIPIVFLHCRALELYLKSFLLKKGMKVEELRSRKYGHNLNELLMAALDNELWVLICGTPLTCSRLHAIVKIMNHDYQSKRIEYPTYSYNYLIADAQFTRILLKRLNRGLGFMLRPTSAASG